MTVSTQLDDAHSPGARLVALLFTDIVDSTQLKRDDQIGALGYLARLQRHNELFERTAAEVEGATILKQLGDGYFVMFDSASEAVRFALSFQARMRLDDDREPALRVRIGIHAAEIHLLIQSDGRPDVVGQGADLAARVMSLASGGQILVTRRVFDDARPHLRDFASIAPGTETASPVKWLAHGPYAFQGIEEPIDVYEVSTTDHATFSAPSGNEKARRIVAAEPAFDNLPLPMTSFVGRSRELAELTAMLGNHRLVTLVGAGGCGKTRLCIEAARATRSNFKHGVCLVELAPLADPALVSSAVAKALSLREELNRPIDTVLDDFLREKQLLLVIDNCEHVLGACAALIGRLLQRSLGLRVLCTSREALNVAGEATFPLAPLAVPDARAEQAIEEMTEIEAVRLFVDRARHVQPGFAITSANAGAIAQICRRLDGIPLAIELSAARVRMFSPADIARRLDNRFNLLIGGARGSLAHHKTLRAMIDWSYDALAPAEQCLLQRLSIFAGGWTLEAAEAVCAGESVAPDDVMDLLSHLVDKSLVHVSGEGNVRYRLLETVRQYGVEKLDATGETARMADAHLDYFLSLAEEAATTFHGPDVFKSFDRLKADYDNLQAAWDALATDGERLSRTLRLATALCDFWCTCGLEYEAWPRVRALFDTMQSTSSAIDPLVRARALVAVATLAKTCSTDGTPWAKAAVESCRSVGDLPTLSDALRVDARAREAAVQLEPLRGFEEALILAHQVGPEWRVARCQMELGRYLHTQGHQNARGCALSEEALDTQRRIGNAAAMGESVTMLASIWMKERKLDRARELIEELERLERLYYGKIESGAAPLYLAQLMAMENDPNAATAFDRVIARVRRSGNRDIEGGFLCLAGANLMLARSDLALPYLRDAIVITQAQASAQRAHVRALLGMALYIHGDWANAESAFIEAIADHKLTNGAVHPGYVKAMSLALCRLGRLAEATQAQLESLTEHQKYDDPAGLASCFVAIASNALVRGHLQDATRLTGAAAIHIESHATIYAIDRFEYDRTKADCRAALGEAEFAAAWEEGAGDDGRARRGAGSRRHFKRLN